MPENPQEFRVDGSARDVFLGERRLDVRLSRQEFNLLQYLYENAGTTCSRQDLANFIWGSVEVGGKPLPKSDDHMLHALVHRTREKLRRAGVDLNHYLTSVTGVGYRLDATPQTLGVAAQPGSLLHRQIFRRSTFILGTAIAITMIVMAAAGFLLLGPSDGSQTAVLPLSSATSTPAVICGSDMISPEPGSVFTASTVIFKWTEGCGMTKYDLWVGCTRDADDFFNAEDGHLLQATVTNLPLDGGPVFVRLTSSDGTEDGTFIRNYAYSTPTNGDGARVVSVPGYSRWFDSGIDLEAGQRITITTCGQVKINSTGGVAFETGGDPACSGVWRYAFPAPNLPCWSFIGRIGDGEPLHVGPSFTALVAEPGRLYLGINDENAEDNTGGFRATIAVSP